MRNYKMCDILTIAGRRANGLKFGSWDNSNTYMSTFDLVVFKVILGSFGGLVSKLPVPRKRLVAE